MSIIEYGQSELEKLQLELFKEREKFSLFLSLNTNCFFEYDKESNMVMFAKNDTFTRLNGLVVSLSEEDFIKKTGIFYEDFLKVEKLIKGQSDGEIEIRFLGEEGDYIWCRMKTAIVTAGNDCQVIGCIHNEDDNHKKIDWLREQSQLDPLTKFYNGHYLKEYIDLYTGNLQPGTKSALFLIDIDDFGRINNNIGRLFGDTVLSNIAEEIRNILPSDSILGRIGSDEFAGFVKDIKDFSEIERLSIDIRNVLKKVYAGGSGTDYITCCIGVSRVPEDGTAYDIILNKAQSALAKARTEGSGSLEIYNSKMVKAYPVSMFHQSGNDFKEAGKRNKISISGQKLTDYTQDLMDTTKDVYSALHLIPEKLAREYRAEAVYILEKIRGKKKLSMNYGFCKSEKKPVKYSVESRYESLFEENDYFDEKGLRIQKRGNVTSISCAFFEEGCFKGMIVIEDGNLAREWTEEEKETLISVTRIISFHLLRLKVSEKIQDRLEHMKNYDALTGMPTLYKFKIDATLKIEREKGPFAIVYSDIGNFKYINDVYGYQFGDRILYDFALSITKFLPEGSVFGRISADNFVALVPFTNEKDLEKEILAFGEKFHDEQKVKHIATNIAVVSGVCLLDNDEKDITTAIDNANTARKSAKGLSAAACSFYSKAMEDKIRREQEITNEMEDALKNREFVVYLQPKVALAKETLAGAEALVRWRRVNGALISPDDFIPLFERNGFIVQLDFYVYEEVCKLLRLWLDKGIPVIPISVNVSRIHLNEDHFVDKIKSLVDSYHVPPRYIELELTESVFVNNTKTTINIMKELRDYGFSVSIDDFGAGYSSLTLLKDMASDVLKLDKEFFSHGEMQKEEQIIVSSIINMAKQLDMKVISEGIETEKQTRFLKNINCDMVQGYYYAKPMPVDEFENFMLHANEMVL